MQKIGIIGSGTVGETLANGFLGKGHAVKRGSRDPGKLAAWKAGAKGEASTGTFAETAAWADVVILAVKGTGAESALAEAGPANLKGKLVLDASNPIADAPPTNGALAFFTAGDDSLIQRLQKLAPEARFVKAWNSVGAAVMIDPKTPLPPAMFICGADAGAKAEAAEILKRFGWEAIDVGGIEMGHAVEALCIVWCAPGFLRNDWSHALAYMKV
ncbi:MAG TPA: NAD(P)-binding domain-containing protein [Kofleriaceae bacterium]